MRQFRRLFRTTLILIALAGRCEGSAWAATTLRIWSATDTAAMTDLIDRFEATHSTIDIDYREFNTAELHAAVLDGRDDAPDVVISSAMDLQVDLVNRGLAIAARDMPELPQWSTWRGELFGFTAEPVAVVYNKRTFEDRPLPRTRSELASMIRDDAAFFARRIGTYDIRQSGVGYLLATQDAQRGYQFSRLVESFGRAFARTFCCTSDMIDAVAEDELSLAYNVIGSYAYERVAADPRLGILLFDDYALIFSRSAFIPKSASNREAAEAFIRYLLSPNGQATMRSASPLLPLDLPENPDGKDWRPEFVRNKPLVPIRMGLGLLTWLDALKRQSFISEWAKSIAGPTPP